MRKLIIIESSCVGAAYTGNAAKLLGYEPIFLTDSYGSQGDLLEQMKKFNLINCDTSSVDNMLSSLKQSNITDIAAVITLCDTTIMLAVELAELLNVPSINPAAKILKDKGDVISLIPEYSPPSIVFDIKDIPYDKIAALTKEYKRVIFKACCSSGGHGSFILDKIEPNILNEKLKLAGIPGYLKPEKWIAQGFMDGYLVSLEGYVEKGKPFFFGFSGRRKIGMTECVNIFPIDAELSLKAQARSKEAVTKLLERSQFNHGYFHIEFMATKDDAYLIDANIGRVGGGGLSQQLAIAYDISPETLYRHILALTLQHPYEEGSKIFTKPSKKTWSVMYGIPKEAILKKVTLPPQFPNFHTRLIEYGALVPPVGISNYSWIGIVSGEASDVEKFSSLIEINTSEGNFFATF